MTIKTQIITINPELIELDKIKIIARVLKKEGIVAYPTDTFYGLGAHCFSEKSIRRIYGLKRRRSSKPLSVFISDRKRIQDITVEVPPLYWKLAAEFWPGPLTLVLKASLMLPKNLLGPGGSIGIRLPALAWLRELVDEISSPITATSANISGEREISTPEQIIESFCGKIDLIVDGGTTGGLLPSTVIDLTSEKPKIIREGAVPYSLLKKYLK